MLCSWNILGWLCLTNGCVQNKTLYSKWWNHHIWCQLHSAHTTHPTTTITTNIQRTNPGLCINKRCFNKCMLCMLFLLLAKRGVASSRCCCDNAISYDVDDDDEGNNNRCVCVGMRKCTATWCIYVMHHMCNNDKRWDHKGVDHSNGVHTIHNKLTI